MQNFTLTRAHDRTLEPQGWQGAALNDIAMPEDMQCVVVFFFFVCVNYVWLIA